jgi:hypothetical protein
VAALTKQLQQLHIALMSSSRNRFCQLYNAPLRPRQSTLLLPLLLPCACAATVPAAAVS